MILSISWRLNLEHSQTTNLDIFDVLIVLSPSFSCVKYNLKKGGRQELNVKKVVKCAF